MNCVAIDDEPVALTIISQFCQRIGDIELSVFTNPIEGIEFIKQNDVDVVFLDIEMGDINGVELAKQLPQGTLLVFTTAYARFALDGFELDAIDFLHKPFSFMRFEKTIQKIQKFGQLIEIQTQETSPDEEITVKVEYKNVKINVKNIRYVEAMDNYVKIYQTKSKPTLSQMSMKTIQEMLPSDSFLRVHKSYIISVNNIEHYTRSKIALKGVTTEIPIGRTYINDVIERLEVKN